MEGAAWPSGVAAGRIQPVGEPERASFRVYLHDGVLAEVERVARRTPGREWGGILFGRRAESGAGQPTVLVECAVGAPEVPGAVRLQLTRAQVQAAAKELARQGREVSPVGWFQTHPGYGVFVSAADCLAHDRCFPRGTLLFLYNQGTREQALYVRGAGGLEPLPGFFLVAGRGEREAGTLRWRGGRAAPRSRRRAAGAWGLPRGRLRWRGSPTRWLWVVGLLLAAALLMVALLPWREARLPPEILRPLGG